jgi:branched-chain amino acid transport system permease protein
MKADPLAAAGLPDGRWQIAELAFWATPFVVWMAAPGHLLLGSQIFVAALFALSLDLLVGYAGMVSLGHAAFFGAGAYTAGLLASHGWGEPLSGLLAGAIVAGSLGWVSSFLVVRGNALSQLMVTLGIGLMFFEAANRAAAITGGVDGLSGMVVAPLFGRFEFDLAGQVAYFYSLAVLVLVFIVVRRIVHSPFGLALRGLHSGPRRMPAIGAAVTQQRIVVFTLAAAIAGVAGALLAQTTQFVGLDSLSFHRSAELLIMLVLGGAGRLYGGLVGAAVFMVAQNWLADLDPVYWQFWMGLLLVCVVLFARGGLLGGLAAIREWRTGGRP